LIPLTIQEISLFYAFMYKNLIVKYICGETKHHLFRLPHS